MVNILTILAHPYKDSTSELLMDNYIIGAKTSNNEIKVIYAYDLKNDFQLKNGYKSIEKNSEIEEIQKLIKWSNKITIFYPIWWGTMPGFTKSLMERIFVPHFGFKYNKNKIPKGLLKNKKIKIINTCDSPKILYQLLYSKINKSSTKNILHFCGIRKIKYYTFGSVRNTKDKTLWLNKIFKIGKNE